jgi:hypothetical protein
MADNTTLNSMTGGDVVRDKDRAGVKTQIVALDLNPAGSETLMGGSMPVTGTFWQATQPVSGTVTANAGTGTFAVSAASLPLPSGAATSAKQDTLAGLVGEVQASPTANTLLDRLKQLLTGIILAAGENHVGQVGGTMAAATANFTRPADTTAYATGDLVANSTTAGSVVAMSFTGATRVAAGSGMIRRARIKKSGTGVTNALFRLHLFKAAPATVTNGDNGVFSVSGVADYIGAFDITVDRAFTDGAYGSGVPITGSEINFKLASGSTIYGLLEARGAYTPGNAEVFTADLEILQD